MHHETMETFRRATPVSIGGIADALGALTLTSRAVRPRGWKRKVPGEVETGGTGRMLVSVVRQHPSGIVPTSQAKEQVQIQIKTHVHRNR